MLGGDWRSLITKDAVQAALATLPELQAVQERSGDENRAVRIYNLSDELLTVTVLDDEGREIPGHGFSARPFDLVHGGWDRGLKTCPLTYLRISGASDVSEYFVNGDSSQGVLVLPPKTEEGVLDSHAAAPMQMHAGEAALAQLTDMGYPETQAAEALAHSNGDVQAAIAHLCETPRVARNKKDGYKRKRTIIHWIQHISIHFSILSQRILFHHGG